MIGALPVGLPSESTGVSYNAINAAKSLAFVIAVPMLLLAVRTAAL